MRTGQTVNTSYRVPSRHRDHVIAPKTPMAPKAVGCDNGHIQLRLNCTTQILRDHHACHTSDLLSAAQVSSVSGRRGTKVVLHYTSPAEPARQACSETTDPHGNGAGTMLSLTLLSRDPMLSLGGHSMSPNAALTSTLAEPPTPTYTIQKALVVGNGVQSAQTHPQDAHHNGIAIREAVDDVGPFKDAA